MNGLNGDNESKVRKILFNEVSLFLALTGTVLSAVFWVSGPQQELKLELARLQGQVEAQGELSKQLQNIKDNDLHEVQRKLDEQGLMIIEVQKSIVRLETLITR